MNTWARIALAVMALVHTSLSGAEALRGLVKGPEGLPISGVNILFVQAPDTGAGDPEIERLGESDATGHFEIDVSAPLGRPGAWVLFDKPPHAISHHPWSQDWIATLELGSGRDIEVKLARGETFTGVLTAADDAPIVGATLTPIFPIALPGHEDIGGLFPPLDAYFGVPTDREGRFSLGRMPAGLDFGIRIHAPERGWSLAGVTLSTFGDRLSFSGASDVRQLVISSFAQVNGVVLSLETGKPSSGVSVLARSRQAIFTGAFLPEFTVETDSKGRYQFSNLPPAHYTLQATAPGQHSAPVSLDALQPTIFSAPEIRLGEGIRYSGRILNADTGAAFAGGDVSLGILREGAAAAEPGPIVNGDGSFEGLAAAGWITLTAFSESLDILPEDRQKRLILVSDHEHNLDIRVRNYATVDIQVFMPDGSPAGGAVVVDRTTRSAPLVCDDEGWLRMPFAAFQLEDPAVHLALEAHARGDESIRGIAFVPMITGDQQNNTITLQPVATLRGIVIDRQGVPQPGKTVYVGYTMPDTGLSIQESVVANDRGEFSLSKIVPGEAYWYHAGGPVTERVFVPGESVEARIISTNPNLEMIKSLSPELLEELSPELKEQLGIAGENTP